MEAWHERLSQEQSIIERVENMPEPFRSGLVELGVKAIHVVPITVTLRHADEQIETVQAKWVVSAEGSSSMVRKTLNIPFEGDRYEGQEFVQTDAQIHWSYPVGEGYMFINQQLMQASSRSMWKEYSRLPKLPKLIVSVNKDIHAARLFYKCK